VSGFDTSIGEKVELRAGPVVLALGMIPKLNKDLATTLKVPQD